eukprot:TRINITY_DN1221_c0_g1_i1.p2 TRINITY_DN1221_c0_g1~~TRINITY_DN1221_c0_g1_i1.p2  ORF type:complete len:346 (+),score=46.32 TRINITY_DN1221_c0_g1_i1:71-1108(+)
MNATIAALAAAAGLRLKPLPQLNIDPSRITSQGASSGGDMAVQFQVSFSSRVRGVCGDDAQPYRCAATRFGGDVLLPQTAESSVPHCLGCPSGQTIVYDHCKNHAGWVNASRLVEVARSLPVCQPGQTHCIDSPTNLTSARVFLTRGECRTYTGNAVVNTKDVFDGLAGVEVAQYFDRCLPDGKKKKNNTERMCFDAMYGPGVRPAAIPSPFHLHFFDQRPFLTDYNVGFASWGAAYIPAACKRNESCGLQVRFHGCGGLGAPGPVELAEANNVVLLYPTIQGKLNGGCNNATATCNAATPVAGNCQEVSRGCWDGYGQLSSEYVLQDAAHMQSVWRMVSHIAGL